MTTTELAQEVEAGREADALIHGRVMSKRVLTEDEMRNEAQRVWLVQPGCQVFTFEGHGFDVHPKTEAARRRGFNSSRPDDIAFHQDLPGYSTDLSAAHEVEARIKELGLEGAYGDALAYLVMDRTMYDLSRVYGEDVFAMAHATPLDRCRAALEAVKQAHPARA